MTNSATAMTLLPYDSNSFYVIQEKVMPKYDEIKEERYFTEKDHEDFINDCKQIFEWESGIESFLEMNLRMWYPLPYDIEGHNDQVENETVKLSEIEIEALLHLVEHKMENIIVNELPVWESLHENLSNCEGELKVTVGYNDWLLDEVFGTLYEGMNSFYKEEEYEDYWNAFCTVYGVDPEED